MKARSQGTESESVMCFTSFTHSAGLGAIVQVSCGCVSYVCVCVLSTPWARGTVSLNNVLCEHACARSTASTSGTRFCMSCANVVKSPSRDCPPGLLGVDTTSLANVVRNSNADIWDMCDDLAARAAAGLAYKTLEQAYGVKYIEGGLLYDIPLRQIHRPACHYIRDWMHTPVSGGVVNTQTALILHECKALNIGISVVRNFSLDCVLPKKYGKVCADWLRDARLKADTVSSFASSLLTVVPIVGMFLVDCVQSVAGAEELTEHIRCYMLLVNILGLLTMGAEAGVAHLDLLATWIVEHHDLYVTLYGAETCKPKWHHMLHLPEHYARLQKIISCFVAERKHRASKAAALHVFRYLEHTVLTDLINRQCQQVVEGHGLFQNKFLAHPRVLEVMGVEYLRSTEAVLACGHIHADDIVYVAGGTIARVVAFWQPRGSTHDNLVAHCMGMLVVGDNRYVDSGRPLFVDTDSIVDACVYRPFGDGVIRVRVPFAARFR